MKKTIFFYTVTCLFISQAWANKITVNNGCSEEQTVTIQSVFPNTCKQNFMIKLNKGVKKEIMTDPNCQYNLILTQNAQSCIATAGYSSEENFFLTQEGNTCQCMPLGGGINK